MTGGAAFPSPLPRLRALLDGAAVKAALLGGLMLLGAVGVTLASVLRGGLLGRPILGDSEAVEMLMGAAVALCIPLAEMRGAHVVVDVFTARLPRPWLAGLDALMRAAVALVVAVLAWRLAVGGYNMWDRERQTMFLEIPLWWGYAGAAVGMTLWLLCALFTAAEAMMRAARPA
ncbi:MAG: TRAP transporter small permease [Rhodovarius sp.]|nr:TRAP transporter small permease [Rhodovarius sp.]MCX7932049.1 TRAP transporter small permease [Rhodovarius sp.]MDW8314107.1 TRAP transporter small permease [Rhodovarius sp.]